MKRNKIVAGNWKMNPCITEGKNLAHELVNKLNNETNKTVIIFPPFTHLSEVSKIVENSQVILGAQNCYYKPNGAFTGEISISMLQELGVEVVLVGHSERREYMSENNALLKEKINALIAQNMKVIFCCGEPLNIREKEEQNEYVKTQLKESLLHLDAETLMQKVIIAYEPIWAIGTGMTASPQQAQDMHAYIRAVLVEQYNEEVAQSICILYGGSCKPDNAAELFACNDIDGGLIGGAALSASSFVDIINA